MMTHKTRPRHQRTNPEVRLAQVRQETQEMLERQSRRIAELEADLDEVLATSDELQAQFLKLRRDTLVAAEHGLTH